MTFGQDIWPETFGQKHGLMTFGQDKRPMTYRSVKSTLARVIFIRIVVVQLPHNCVPKAIAEMSFAEMSPNRTFSFGLN